MRLIGQDSLHNADELVTFSARSSVTAIRCDDGAAVLDGNGDTLDSYDRPCYALVDGDDVQLVPAVIFDALYEERDSSAPEPTPEPTSARQDDRPQTVQLSRGAGTGDTPAEANAGTNPLIGTTNVTPVGADVSTDIGPGAAYGHYASAQNTAGPTPGPEAPTPTVEPGDSETTEPAPADSSTSDGESTSASTA